MSARAEPRLTRDADLAVLVAGDRDAETLVLDLQARGWRVVAAIEQDAAGRLGTIRLALADPRTTTGQILWSDDVLHPELGRRGWLREL